MAAGALGRHSALANETALSGRQNIMTVLVTSQPAKRNEYFTQCIQKNIVLDEIVE